MKKLVIKTLIVIASFMLFTNSIVMAVTEAEEPNENLGKIYVIGNKDLGKIESYDEETKTYVGVMPKLFEIVKEKTGIEIEYKEIKNDRATEIQNTQGEIVSGIIGEEYPEIADRIKVFTLPEQQEIYIGFTKIINPETKEKIIEAINGLTNEEREKIIVETYNKEIAEVKAFKGYYYIITLVIVAVIVLVISIYIKKLKEKIKKEKYTDNITGYSNFENFEKSYNKFITDEVKNNYCIVDLGIDLSNIEEIYGYAETEEVLRKVSNILNEYVEDNELFCRKTNNSFIMLLDYISPKHLEERIIVISDKISKITTRYEITARFGIYYLKATDKNLDRAIYYAMQARKVSEENLELYTICNKGLINKVEEKYNLEKAILESLKKQEFVSYVQPIMDITGRQIYAIEILARWENEKLGFIKPRKFLKILEKNNMVYDVDMLMFENACKLLNKWRKEEKRIFRIFCNFSRKSLIKEGFIESIIETIEKYQIDPRVIGIVVTDNILSKNAYNIRNIVNELVDMGFQIILDNFGGSASSINDIAELKIDCIKIAPKLVNNLEQVSKRQVIHRIISLAKNQGMQVICENIDNQEAENILREMDCTLMKGNFYCQAVPIEFIGDRDFEHFLEQRDRV